MFCVTHDFVGAGASSIHLIVSKPELDFFIHFVSQSHRCYWEQKECSNIDLQTFGFKLNKYE